MNDLDLHEKEKDLKEPIKLDVNKPRLDLIPQHVLIEVGKVLEFGARKYDDNNWLKGTGFKYGRIFAAIMRHGWKFWSGEEYDDESGLHHLAHLITDAMFLLEYIIIGKGIDDRYKGDKKYDK